VGSDGQADKPGRIDLTEVVRVARKELTFNFLGYKKASGFRPIQELMSHDFYPPDAPPPEVSRRIAEAFIAVLGRRPRTAGPPAPKAE